MIQTPRLTLIPATWPLLSAETSAPNRFSTLLKAEVPHSWPPPSLVPVRGWFSRQIREGRSASCWYMWYVIYNLPDQRRILVATCGFLGAPDPYGIIEIGYAVLGLWQKKGIATEAVSALLDWAMKDPHVKAIRARTGRGNQASFRVLEKNGFHLRKTDPMKPSILRLERIPHSLGKSSGKKMSSCL